MHGQRRWRPTDNDHRGHDRPFPADSSTKGGELCGDSGVRCFKTQKERSPAEILARGGGCEVGVHRTRYADRPGRSDDDARANGAALPSCEAARKESCWVSPTTMKTGDTVAD